MKALNSRIYGSDHRMCNNNPPFLYQTTFYSKSNITPNSKWIIQQCFTHSPVVILWMYKYKARHIRKQISHILRPTKYLWYEQHPVSLFLARSTGTWIGTEWNENIIHVFLCMPIVELEGHTTSYHRSRIVDCIGNQHQHEDNPNYRPPNKSNEEFTPGSK